MKGRAALLLAGSLLLLVPLAFIHGASAQSVSHPPTFDGAAVADGVRVNVTAPAYVIVEEFVDSGAPVAQATFDSAGTASGLASAPYPGALALSASPTATGSLGLPSAPQYPLMATSGPDQHDQHVDAPGYSLTATTTDTSVSAVANAGNNDAGQAAGSSAADASTAFSDDGTSLVSVAHTSSTGFRLGTFVTIGSVRSSASAIGAPDQPVQRATELSVDGMSLLGVPVSVTPQGLVAAGQTTPVSLDSILAQLASSGVTVRVVAPIDLPDGVTAGGLVVSYTATTPPPGPPQVVTTVTFGRAMARASASGESAPAPTLGIATPSGATVSSTAPAPKSRSGSAIASRSTTKIAPKRAAAARPAGPSPVNPVPMAVWALYLIVVITAVAVAGCAQLVRLFGVKLWIS